MWAGANLFNYLGPFQPGLLVRIAFFQRAGVGAAAAVRASFQLVFFNLLVSIAVAGAGLLAIPDARARLSGSLLCGAFLLYWLLARLAQERVSSLLLRAIRRFVPNVSGGIRLLPSPRVLFLVALEFVLLALTYVIVYRGFGIAVGAHAGYDVLVKAF